MNHAPVKTITRRQLIKSGLRGAAALGGLGALAGAPGCKRRTAWQPAVSTVILITLDTTRADHLGCYGYARSTSPKIDDIAKGAMVYENAIAPGTWTLPSHASLFTGKYTASHGARFDPNGSLHLTQAISGPDNWQQLRVQTLGPDEQTLASLLKARGYVTGGVVAGPWMKGIFGLNQGFDFWDDSNIQSLNGRAAEQVSDQALAFLSQTAGLPRLLFLNYFDPHAPYAPPAPFTERFVEGSLPELRSQYTDEHLIALYDAEIRYMDTNVMRVLDALKRSGHYDDALIIMTADHGEMLGEHGLGEQGLWGHSNIPYQPVLRVPLIVKYPGAATTGRSTQPVQLTDVLPIILDALQIPVPAQVQGDLPSQIDHPILIESRTLPGVGKFGHWTAIIEGHMKCVFNDTKGDMLFNLQDDPGESHNLIDRYPQQVAALRIAVDQYLKALPTSTSDGPAQQVDPETIEALKGLGYLK